MKKLLLLLVFMGIYANAQIVNIPDANFKAKLLSASASNQIAKNLSGNYFKIDTSNDGEIQVSEALQVSYLDVSNIAGTSNSSQISSLTGIEHFTQIQYLDCSINNITNLNLGSNTSLTNLDCGINHITSLNLVGFSGLSYLDCVGNLLTSIDVDNNTSLTYLNCSINSLTSLNVNNNTLLTSLSCYSNQLTSLNVNSNTLLTSLDCSNNQLTSLNVNNNTSLTSLNCSSNQLTTLNVNNNISLTSLNCSSNQLTTLNVNNNTLLTSLGCGYNQLTSLNMNNNTLLTSLGCGYNQLTSIDVSNMSEFYNLDCRFNTPLTTILMKNGSTSSIYFLTITGNINLQYICADENRLLNIQLNINNAGLAATCLVNSYCSFTPGGTYYTINGTNHYDENNNGCDAGDIAIPNFKINITNGTVMGSFIANTTGNYTIPVQSGTHTLTPQIENPTYFNVSPTTTSITFPTQASPFTQDYCVSANGTHHDLEVTIIPINVARPGFDATYKIIYKNKGTNTETATLNFNYDDTVLDFVSATTTPTTQNVGNLVWSLGTVAPFQSGEIMLTLNLNAPTETPALNAGDVLNYSAIINGAFTDETPIDNTFNLPQNVVNSYDPNDKTCLEGQTISNNMIGQYVHYMIRFENTGTYPAQNIVVKDMIDTAKFDVSTLQMTKASHDCYTRINGNKVEFIFENINLPFDDANNDGYVVFKIKTLPTLAQNSSVSNTADIFFDYNFPITTNTATTNFANLATQNVAKAQVSVYPNPAKNTINIKSESEINSISIFDIQGRQIQTKIVGATETVLDISNLQQGNYMLKINTEKGIATEKIVKE